MVRDDKMAAEDDRMTARTSAEDDDNERSLLIVATHVAPARGYGGVAESVTDLARIWTGQGHAVHLVASDASSTGNINAAQVTSISGCPVSLYRSTFFKKQGFGLSAIGLLWRAIGEADLIYIGGVSTWPTSLALLYCRLQHKAFGVGVRGGFLRGHLAHIRASKPIKRLFYDLFVRPLANGARCIHAMSEMEREHIAPLFVAPVVVAALGVDCRALKPAPPLAPLAAGGRRYLYVGRFSPEKSVAAMIRAWRKGARDQDRLTLAGDGEGEYVDQVKSLAHPDHRIRQLGYVPRNQVFDEIRAHDFLIMPSGMEADVRENFGIVVAEALALGRPVLVAKGLAWDRLEEGGAGFVFAPSTLGLGAALKRSALLTECAYKHMAAAARQYAETSVSLANEAEKLHAYLETKRNG